MRIVRCRWFPPRGYAAITLVWWLVVRTNVRVTDTLVNHEEIHGRQQREMLVALFFAWYALEFAFRLIQYRNWHLAYRNISFECEAYANEGNPGYLAGRKRYAWIKYINPKQ